MHAEQAGVVEHIQGRVPNISHERAGADCHELVPKFTGRCYQDVSQRFVINGR